MASLSAVIKSDMLSASSTAQETLRAMYLYGVDHILVAVAKKERLLHKDQLVCLLEQGREAVTLGDLLPEIPKELQRAAVNIEDVPQSASLLLLAQGELSRTTFGEYRSQKVMEAAARLPDWWSVPLPLLFADEHGVYLNDTALNMIPGGAKALADQADGWLKERIITLREKKGDRTLALSPLTEKVYFLEDISGDFEMAEDLLWWAAAGRAFVRRMEKNGLVVRRLSPYEPDPENAAETIPCSWEGELMGKLAIEIPGSPEGEGSADD